MVGVVGVVGVVGGRGRVLGVAAVLVVVALVGDVARVVEARRGWRVPCLLPPEGSDPGRRTRCATRARVAPATGVTTPTTTLTASVLAGLLRLECHRVGMDDVAAAVAVLARRREDLKESLADPLAGHLDQTQRGDLCHLMSGAVPAEALHQPTQDEVSVALQDHVDEVDHDDAADVAEPQLANDLLGRLEVVPGDRFLEVAALTGEATRVDVDDRHRLGPVDHQRAARGQPDLAIQCLGELLVDAVRGEEVIAPGPQGQSLHEVRRHPTDVVAQRRPHVVPLHDQRVEVLIEDVADHLDS